MEDQSFYQWVLLSWKRWIPVSIPFGFTPLPFLMKAEDLVGSKWLMTSLLALQTLVILILLATLKRPVHRPDLERASAAATQFYRCWRSILLVWLIFYGVMTVNALLDVVPGGPRDNALVNVLLNALNNGVTLGFFIAYIVLAEKTVLSDGDHPHASHLPWELGIGIVALLALADLATTLAELNIAEAFKWLTGVMGGLGIAVVIGRLDSKYFGVPVPVIVLLYLYAVIQAGWANFDNDPVLKVSLITAALPLKVMLLFVVKWAFETGRFHYYADRMGPLVDEIDAERKKFLKKLAKPSLQPVPAQRRGMNAPNR